MFLRFPSRFSLKSLKSLPCGFFELRWTVVRCDRLGSVFSHGMHFGFFESTMMNCIISITSEKVLMINGWLYVGNGNWGMGEQWNCLYRGMGNRGTV